MSMNGLGRPGSHFSLNADARIAQFDIDGDRLSPRQLARGPGSSIFTSLHGQVVCTFAPRKNAGPGGLLNSTNHDQRKDLKLAYGKRVLFEEVNLNFTQGELLWCDRRQW